MKKVWGYVVAAFSLILGLFFMERSKRRSAEALNDNADTLEKVRKKESEVMKNNAQLLAEEQLRNNEREALESKKNEDLSASNLVDFFNKRK